MSIGDEAGDIPRWTLADRLRKSLDHANVTSAEMAEYLEVHRNTVSNWIYGRAKPPSSAVKLWAMRTGVPYEWLTTGHAKAPRPDEAGDTDSVLSEIARETRPSVREDIKHNFRKYIPIRDFTSTDLAIAR